MQTVIRKSIHTLWPKADVIYYVDLRSLDPADRQSLKSHEIVSRHCLEEIQAEEEQSLFENIDKSLLLPQLKERFRRGATLWLIKKDHCTAGKVWTLAGSTIEPYYYFLTPGDVHLFNDLVFEPYRGQGMNRILLCEVLYQLKAQRHQRAFIEANLRNIQERRSLAKTPFVVLGLANKKSKGARNVTRWTPAVALRADDLRDTR